MIGNIRFARMNDLASVEELINDRTCAIILETVQGEGGLVPATEEFLKGVKALCEEKGHPADTGRDSVRHGTNRLYVCMAEVWCEA